MPGEHLVDNFLWQSKPREAKGLLMRYQQGQLTYRQLKIKLYYLRKEACLVNQISLEFEDEL